MNKKILMGSLALAAVSFMAVSCSSDEPMDVTPTGPNTFPFSIVVGEGGTRVTAEDDGTRQMKFTDGDKIYVYGEADGKTITGELTSPDCANKSTATFTGELTYSEPNGYPAQTFPLHMFFVPAGNPWSITVAADGKIDSTRIKNFLAASMPEAAARMVLCKDVNVGASSFKFAFRNSRILKVNMAVKAPVTPAVEGKYQVSLSDGEYVLSNDTVTFTPNAAADSLKGTFFIVDNGKHTYTNAVLAVEEATPTTAPAVLGLATLEVVDGRLTGNVFSESSVVSIEFLSLSNEQATSQDDAEAKPFTFVAP